MQAITNEIVQTILFTASIIATFFSFISLNLEAFFCSEGSIWKSTWLWSSVILFFISPFDYFTLKAFVLAITTLNIVSFGSRRFFNIKQKIWRISSFIEGLKYVFSLNLAFLIALFADIFLKEGISPEKTLLQLVFIINGIINAALFVKTSISRVTRETVRPVVLVEREDEKEKIVKEEEWIIFFAIIHLAISYGVIALLGTENLVGYISALKEKLIGLLGLKRWGF